jgi:nucleoid-associated protein YgaU
VGLFDRVKDLLTSSDAERARSAPETAERSSGKASGMADQDGAGVEEQVDQVDPQAPAHEPRTHTVVRGDTLVAIAERYGVDWRHLAAANHLDNPDLIYPGQVFTVPDR